MSIAGGVSIRGARRWPEACLPLLAIAAAVLVAGCSSQPGAAGSQASSPAPFPTPPLTAVDPGPLLSSQNITWQNATRIDESTVDINFVANASGCRRLAEVRVVQSASAVTVTLLEGVVPARAAEACPGVGTLARTRVWLGAPLGGRRLLDGGVNPPVAREIRAS